MATSSSLGSNLHVPASSGDEPVSHQSTPSQKQSRARSTKIARQSSPHNVSNSSIADPQGKTRSSGASLWNVLRRKHSMTMTIDHIVSAYKERVEENVKESIKNDRSLKLMQTVREIFSKEELDDLPEEESEILLIMNSKVRKAVDSLKEEEKKRDKIMKEKGKIISKLNTDRTELAKELQAKDEELKRVMTQSQGQATMIAELKAENARLSDALVQSEISEGKGWKAVGRKNYILQDVRAEIVECQRELEREKLRREKEERLKTKIASYIKPLRQRNLELENLVAKREDRERKENERITELGDLLGKQQKLLERAEQRVVLESSMKEVTIDDMNQVMLDNARYQERVEGLEDEKAEFQKRNEELATEACALQHLRNDLQQGLSQLEQRLKAETALRISLQASLDEKSEANRVLGERVEELNSALTAAEEKKVEAENSRKLLEAENVNIKRKGGKLMNMVTSSGSVYPYSARLRAEQKLRQMSHSCLKQ